MLKEPILQQRGFPQSSGLFRRRL